MTQQHSSVCRHFLRGTCRMGTSCRFSHFRSLSLPGNITDTSSMQSVNPQTWAAIPGPQKQDHSRMFPQTSPCRHFVRNAGWCPDGDKCAYIHDSQLFPFGETDLKPHCWAFVQGRCPARRCHYFHPTEPWSYAQYTPCPEWKSCNRPECPFKHRIISEKSLSDSKTTAISSHDRPSPTQTVPFGFLMGVERPWNPWGDQPPHQAQRPQHRVSRSQDVRPTYALGIPQHISDMHYPYHGHPYNPQPEYIVPSSYPASYPFHPPLQPRLPPPLPVLLPHLQFPSRANGDYGFSAAMPPPPFHYPIPSDTDAYVHPTQNSQTLDIPFLQLHASLPMVQAPRPMYPSEIYPSVHEQELQEQELLKRVQFAMSPPSMPHSFPTSRSISQPIEPTSAMAVDPEPVPPVIVNTSEPVPPSHVGFASERRQQETLPKVRFADDVQKVEFPQSLPEARSPADDQVAEEHGDYTKSRLYTAENEFPYRPPQNQRVGHARRIRVAIKRPTELKAVAVGA